MEQELRIPVNFERRSLAACLNYDENCQTNPQQLIIMATGIYSHMDKNSQKRVASWFRNANFAVMQFNWEGHGHGNHLSDGNIEDVTLSSSIKDLKAVWNFAQTSLPNCIDNKHIALNANSYGALASLIALERRDIAPESMVLVAPYSVDRIKPWAVTLNLLSKIIPNQVENLLRVKVPDRMSRILKLTIKKKMLADFVKNHMNALKRDNLLGSTAVHFFVGDKDNISSSRSVVSLCEKINGCTLETCDTPEDLHAHYTIYPGVGHFNMPMTVQKDINHAAIDFIRKTRASRERS